MFCKNCGKILIDNAKFCNHCGTEHHINVEQVQKESLEKPYKKIIQENKEEENFQKRKNEVSNKDQNNKTKSTNMATFMIVFLVLAVFVFFIYYIYEGRKPEEGGGNGNRGGIYSESAEIDNQSNTNSNNSNKDSKTKNWNSSFQRQITGSWRFNLQDYNLGWYIGIIEKYGTELEIIQRGSEIEIKLPVEVELESCYPDVTKNDMIKFYGTFTKNKISTSAKYSFVHKQCWGNGTEEYAEVSLYLKYYGEVVEGGILGSLAGEFRLKDLQGKEIYYEDGSNKDYIFTELNISFDYDY